jgi:uncharacterized NAD-dependent epimerase/dehydratase family protein
VTPGRDGNAIVYCEGAFNTPNGKTAHGLVRFTERYRVLAVVDSHYAGRDAGEVLDGTPKGVPVVVSIDEALEAGRTAGEKATHFVIGIAPDGGRLSAHARRDVMAAIALGLNVDSGLHDFLGEDPEIAPLADRHGVVLRDVRQPPPRHALHFFTGRIEEVTAFRVAMLGTDSAVGKRTTAWHLVHGMRAAGVSAELVGTGQTAWMQGARYGIVLDSLVNDFVSGEIEHAVWSAWKETSPEVIVLEGQGSLLNPAYPGGFELLAAGRPHVIVLQHAPARVDYDGFPGYRIHPLPKQIRALEEVSDRPVVAITINHEGIPRDRVGTVCTDIADVTGLPVFDTLVDGPAGLVGVLRERMRASG